MEMSNALNATTLNTLNQKKLLKDAPIHKDNTMEKRYRLQTNGLKYKIQRKKNARFFWKKWSWWEDMYAFTDSSGRCYSITTKDAEKAKARIGELSKIGDWENVEDV